jgi:LacI family transcriptional regulator
VPHIGPDTHPARTPMGGPTHQLVVASLELPVGPRMPRGQGWEAIVAEQVTLADVARWAGVSVATASRALHGSAGRTVNPELRARVQAAAAELNYSPNANAQAVVRGTTTTVGLVVHDIADPSAAALAAGVIAAAATRNLIVTICPTLSDPLAEVRQVEALRRQRARAIILAGSRFNDPESAGRLGEELIGYAVGGGHVAVVGQHRMPVNTVEIDNLGSARRLAATLAGLGYRRPAVLAGPEMIATSEDRVTGFREGLAQAGVPLAEENVIGAPFTRDGGYVAMTELLDHADLAAGDIDLVFAVNDVMAVGATAALRDQGLDVPGDVAVAGFDDIVTLRDVRPALTTVRLPMERIGGDALDLALGTRFDADAGNARLITVSGDVVVRESTPLRR